jgi:CDGSH-type Zn-finger protein
MEDRTRVVPTIEPRPNGPYVVKNLTELHSAEGEALAVKAVTALCRCGKSSTKPYCDGTHAKVGFQSARESDPALDVRTTYTGHEITIYDNRSICAHDGHCTDGQPTVFRSGKTPWIDPYGAAPCAVAQVIRQCPSGALGYALHGQAYVEPETPPTIALIKNGPYSVTGGIALNEPFRQGASPRRYTLCRCGQSKNKPFCDGSHWEVGFEG